MPTCRMFPTCLTRFPRSSILSYPRSLCGTHRAMGAARALGFRWSGPPVALIALGSGALYSSRERTQSQRQAYFQADQQAWLSTSALLAADNGGQGSKYGSSSGSNASSSPSENSQDSASIWTSILQKLDGVKHSVGSADWMEIDHLKNYIIPDWTHFLPATMQKLQRELEMAPGSLADDIWKEAHDPDLNPEILREAKVRVSDKLCDDELAFRRKRQAHAVHALATYLGIPAEDIHPEDVPTIAVCGSGGGLRALVAGTGSYLAANEAGLWDCVTYTAGVSGSCWLQTLYHSSITGHSFGKLVDHLKNRLNIHIAFPAKALDLLTTAPTNKYLLRGLVEKLKGDPGADFGLVDIYGLLLAARLLVPKGELAVSDDDLKLSNQRYSLATGAHPLPIYTAVRHEIPVLSDDDELPKPRPTPEALIKKSKQEAWFQWFEFTPYEFFCEELNAGIPTWALGRHFNQGKDTTLDQDLPTPEFRVPGLMGIWGSAFCATLSHYYKEIRPVVRGIAGFGGIDSLIQGKSKDLVRVHPIDPATIPNYVLGMRDQLPSTCPESILQSQHLRLMDAGMSNNLPIYPLLRPGRDVDVIVAFDASADIKQENWLSAVDGYARQRGIKGWPKGAGWPQAGATAKENAEALREPQNITQQALDEKIQEAKDSDRSSPSTSKPDAAASSPHETDLDYCNVWVGTTQEKVTDEEPPPSKRLFHPADATDHSESDFHLMRPDAGVAVVYFPLLPNDDAPDAPPSLAPAKPPLPAKKAADPLSPDEVKLLNPHARAINPDVDDFLSTWNFVYSPGQIDSVIGLAKANFARGEDRVKRVVRAVYERKKADRLRREDAECRQKLEGFVPL